jgi:2',3'-cyclic-nucleotide 2'-phosphodiesterase/3'-nucleotidase
LRYIREPLAETQQPLHSFFSLLTNDAALQLIARARADHLRRKIAGSDLAALPLLSSGAPFKAGRRGGPDHYTHIPKGAITRRGLADLYPHANTLCAVRLCGRSLREWLEHSASVFSQITKASARDTPLLREGAAGYRFEIIHGLSYEIDLSQPPRYAEQGGVADTQARRIRKLRWNGVALDEGQEFLLATNSFRAHDMGLDFMAGGDGKAPAIVYESATDFREILQEFICRESPLDRSVRPVWRFTPQGGAKARFRTSPLARRYLDDPRLPPLEDLGDTSEGFAAFRVTL